MGLELVAVAGHNRSGPSSTERHKKNIVMTPSQSESGHTIPYSRIQPTNPRLGKLEFLQGGNRLFEPTRWSRSRQRVAATSA